MPRLLSNYFQFTEGGSVLITKFAILDFDSELFIVTSQNKNWYKNAF